LKQEVLATGEKPTTRKGGYITLMYRNNI